MGILHDLSSELEGLVSRSSPAVVSVQHDRGQGSGVLLAPDGYLLTNAHVVQGAEEVRIGLFDGTEAKGRVAGRDERTDVAVVRAEGGPPPFLPLAADRRVRVGQIVLAIGNPFRFERSVSLGVVSALDRSLPAPRGGLYEGLIQTDAAINPGNSGGPLLDMDGAVVGINTAVIPFAQGIGFAVPAHTASWVAAVLIQKGEIRRPFLGVTARGVELPAPLSQEAGQSRAVHIFGVAPSTPAAEAGLRQGDLLLKANGTSLASVDDLQRVMVLSEPVELRVEILREKKHRDVVVRPAAEPRAA